MLHDGCMNVIGNGCVVDMEGVFEEMEPLTENGVEFDDVKTAVFDSPFHYNEQVTYYQYSGSDGQRPEVLANMIYTCHERYNKRMMVLFTNRSQLEATLQLLQQKQGGRDLPIFAQKRQTSRSGLVRGMHQTSNGILLGTNAFWEGVDLPGDLLEILFIVKILKDRIRDNVL